MALRLKQAMVALGTTAAATLMPVVTATPASAAYVSCLQYVDDHGYIVGPRVRAACDHRALKVGTVWFGNAACITGLVQIGVESGVAQGACKRAH